MRPKDQRERNAARARQWNKDNAERRAVYDAQRRTERRALLIKHLGGKCVKCGCDDPNQLEFDHIDASTKTIHISRRIARAIETILEEIEKCQLLCNECHKAKTFGWK